MNLFDHHTHTDRSDGRISLEERARSTTIRPQGVSDHYPHKMRNDDDVLRYVEDARNLGLRVSVEYDLGIAVPLRPSTLEQLDYVIGAVHQVFRNGVRIGYDAAGGYLKGGRTGAFSGASEFRDPELQRHILEQTLLLVREGIEIGIDILGHPTFTPLAALGDPEDVYPREWQDRLLDLCVSHGIAIELNEAYGVPHAGFLDRAKAAGARFSLGSDSHAEPLPLVRTSAMIESAALDPGRFLDGRRVGSRADRGRAPGRSPGSP